MMIRSFLMTLLLAFILCPLIGQISLTGEGFPANQQLALKQLQADKLEYTIFKQWQADKNGNFSFVFDGNPSNLYQLIYGTEERVYLAFAQEEAIRLTLSAEGLQMEGSPASQKMQAFPARMQELQARYFGQLKKELDAAMAAKDESKTQKIMQEVETVMPSFLKDLRASINAMGISPAGYYALQFSDFNKEQAYIRERLKLFQEQLPNSPVTQALLKQVSQASATAVGKIPPAFTATDKNGNPVGLAQFQGKILLIDFWAGWCRACRVENPKLASLYQRYSRDDLEVLSIGQDQDKESWLKAMEKDGIQDWYHIWDPEDKIGSLFGVSSLPQNLVLGRDGKVIAKNVDAEQLTALLENILE